MEKTATSGSRQGQSEREIYERQQFEQKREKEIGKKRSIGLVINLEGGRTTADSVFRKRHGCRGGGGFSVFAVSSTGCELL